MSAARGIACAAFAAGLLAPLLFAVAAAQWPERRVGIRWERGIPLLDVSIVDVASPRRVRDDIDSGLPRDLVVSVLALREGSARPVAVEERTCSITYDLLDDRYRVEMRGVTGSQTFWIRTRAAVLERCAVLRAVPIGTAEMWRRAAGATVRFHVSAEFEPVSRRDLERLRRWLASSGGGRSEPDAFYGSVVSRFVDRNIRSATHQVRFRSQPVTVPR
ncbi:MAG: hypothetical protein NZ898_05445 [Myxococcota bacterium]|nr:hypothetical protein [Myxococcota bacterium]MDW8362074.1 hypothetical protein [Myxococcales bacterium]